MIIRTAREIPLFESLGIFTEAPKKKKRKPRVVSVRPIKTDYADLVDPEELFDVEDIDDTSEDIQGFDDLSEDIDDFDDIPNEADLDYEDQEDLGDLGSDLDSLSIDDIDVNDVVNEPEIAPTEPTPVEGEQTEVIDTATGTGEENPEQPETEPTEPAPVEGAVPVEDETSTPVEGETLPEQPAEEIPPAEEGGEVIDATTGENGANIEDTGDLGADVSLDTPADDGTINSNADPTATDPNAGQSVTKDDVRKHEMYKRFLDLYNAIVYFIERLESGVSDSERFELASTKALSKFKRIENLTRDYMLLKFQTDSFLQNSFFYEKIKAICLLNFKSLELNKNKKEESKH